MKKGPTTPLKITAHLLDGRLNSPDGIVMLDAIMYHAWFLKNCPEVIEGKRCAEYDGHMGLPLRHVDGSRYAASRGIYDEVGKAVEYVNKRPNFFNPDKIQHLNLDKGIISDSVGIYRAYRIPNVIRTIKNGRITFWTMGHKEEVEELLSYIPAVGKKPAAGYGIVTSWEVEDCEDDYSLWHPDYGLMRPVEVGSDEGNSLDLTGYPVIQYGVKPPYWKPQNMRWCHVPI